MGTKDGGRLKAYIRLNTGVSPRQAHAREIFKDWSLDKRKKGKGEGEYYKVGSGENR